MQRTLREIAAAASVSISTASRALNGHPAISEETVTRVRQAAEDLRYERRRTHGRPDARRRLVDARIGVFSLGMDRSLIALPVIAAAIGGAEQALSGAGASVQLAHVPNVKDPPTSLLRQRLDGVILTGAMQGALLGGVYCSLIDRLRALPTVWVLGRPAGCWGDAVASNDYLTGELAAEYLVARGHRLLAFVNPKPDQLLFRRREDGFVASARRLGAEVRCFCESPVAHWELPLPAPLGVELVQDLVDRLIASRPRPTAILAAADSVAVLVYRALAVRELRVGRDLSVISGNNDAPLIAGLHPHLTTFDVHAHDLGRLAVRQLAARMSDPSAGDLPDGELLVAPTLVEAGSVARLPLDRCRAL
jgi:LacI family transcriptional regulator